VCKYIEAGKVLPLLLTIVINHTENQKFSITLDKIDINSIQKIRYKMLQAFIKNNSKL